MAAKTPQMREIEDNWRQTKPDLYARLKANGTLATALQDEASRMTSEIDALTAGGMTLAEATEKVRPEYLTPTASEPPMSAEDQEALDGRAETWRLANSMPPMDEDVIVRDTRLG